MVKLLNHQKLVRLQLKQSRMIPGLVDIQEPDNYSDDDVTRLPYIEATCDYYVYTLYTFIHFSTNFYLSLSLSMHLFIVFLSVWLSVCLSTYLSMYQVSY